MPTDVLDRVYRDAGLTLLAIHHSGGTTQYTLGLKDPNQPDNYEVLLKTKNTLDELGFTTRIRTIDTMVHLLVSYQDSKEGPVQGQYRE